MATNTKISKKREGTAQRIITALRETQGLQALAARRAGVHLMTVHRYAHEFPSVRQALEEQKETNLDFAEGKLYKAIRDGNMTAIIFYLKTQGKARGYIEKVEADVGFVGKITHEHTIKFEQSDLRGALQNLLECGAVQVISIN